MKHKDGKRYLRMSFVSASLDFIKGVAKAVNDNLGMTRNYHRNRNCYAMDFGHQLSIKLGQWIYDKSEGIRMDRKYNSFLEGQKIILANNKGGVFV